jgi:hypothetical protein
MSFTKSCGPCHGTGFYGFNSKDICKVCSGVGVISFEGQSDEYQKCGPCHGSGYHSLIAKDTCTICNGVGLVSLKAAHKAALPSVEDEFSPIWNFIHPVINRVARSRFEAGHLADSVEAALKEINSIIKAKVKALSGSELGGADLMYKAFSPKSPLIQLDDLGTVSGNNIQ